MKKVLLGVAAFVTVAMVGTFSVASQKTMGLGFIIPQINDKANVANPAEGEVVYDQSDNGFYGRGSSGWINLGGGSNLPVPSGVISAFAGSSAPTGYLLCDGSAVSRTTYADLFAAIGTSYGSGDGATTFNLPDLRGRFLRGVDGGTGRDPDASSRTAIATGGAVGDNVGSLQSDQFRSHTHTAPYNGNGGSGYPAVGYAAGDYTTVLGTMVANNPSGGNETRPVNVYVNYIIKH